MNKVQIGILLMISLFTISCTTGLTDKETAKLNKLQYRVDSTIERLSSIDTAKSLASANHFFENLRFIQKEMKDTINPETALFLDSYYSLRKSFNMFGEQYPLVLRELTTTKKQLSDLEHDADNGLLAKGQFEQYYHLESNNLILAEEKANEVLYAIETIQPLYDKMNPKVDSLLNSYKIKAAAKE